MISIDEYQLQFGSVEDAESTALVQIAGRSSYSNFVHPQDLAAISYESYLKDRIQYLGNPNIRNIVAIFENRVIGFCDFGIPTKETIEYAEQNHQIKIFKGELINLFVEPNHQKLGIGKKLLNEARRLLIKEKRSPFILWTLKENRLARKFYENQSGIFIENCEMPIRLGNTDYPLVAYRFD